MMRPVAYATLALVLTWTAAPAQADRIPTAGTEMTPLDQYVAAPDASYAWRLVSRRDDDEATALVLDLASQTWRTDAEIDRPLWQHWLAITIPKTAATDTGLLFIGGGHNRAAAPRGPSQRARAVALATRSVVAELGQTPNQPLVFRGDGRARKEDDLVARSWRESLQTGDPQWAAQFPMTKSAVRAMDATQEAVREYGFPELHKFVVSG
ncbi:MAG TPA: PhoPQ-activated protein PqaA family protein, partial [Lacipirellulaceae bacterium]|nr:PhoPQ-activated protein PqaA family protein [Lacipirellulaceae bacterium]